MARGAMESAADDLDDALVAVPTVFWIAGRTVAQGLEDESGALRRLRISRYGDPRMALMFDPVLAARLGWLQTTDDPFSFYDHNNQLMATTRFWRDGWHQDTYYPLSLRWAEGERVELTEEGAQQVGQLSGMPTLTTTRWRTILKRGSKPKLSAQWSSNS